MDPLPPIPIPPGQRWREFRLQAVPIIVFLTVLSLVVIIWRGYVSLPNLMGEVEVIRENVASPKAGVLSQLNVTSFQSVKAGDVVAYVITTEPRILASSLAIIQAEIGLMRVNLEPILGQQRYVLSYDRARLDWMEQKVALATARVKLQLAVTELRRTEELFKEKILSEGVLDEARSAKEKLETEVEERTTLVEEQERTLQQLRLVNAPQSTPLSPPAPQDTMRAAIAVQEEKLRLAEAELSPITLRVPIDGMISTVHRRSGETIMAGESILTISAHSSDRIVGYMRQPLPFEPKVGMAVEIRSRSSGRQICSSKILRVGTQMEPVGTAQLSLANAKAVETGLPILVGLPPELKLRPGELVELKFHPF